MRSPVTSVIQWQYYNRENVLTEITDYEADLDCQVASVTAFTRPVVSTRKKQVGYVDYVCGYATPPADMVLAIKLLAAHYYVNREAFREQKLECLPMGFQNIASKYRTGMSGSWGM